MKNILVVGGTGYIGYYLLKSLSKHKVSLSSISLHAPKKQRRIKKVNYYICDYTNKSQLKDIENKFDYVINACGYFFSNKKTNLKKNYNHHYSGLKNLTEHFNSKKIKIFLHIGSSLEYGNSSILCKENMKCKPSTEYGKIKLKCTKYLISIFKKNNYPACVVRLFSIYGGIQNKGLMYNLLKFIKIKSKKKFVIDYKILDLCHIDDVVNGLVKLLFSNKSRGEIFNLGSGNLISTDQIKHFFQEKISKSKYLFNNLKIRYNNSYSICPDVSKVRNKMKWNAKKNFSKEMIKLFKKNNIL